MPTCQETISEYFAAIRAMDADRFANTFTPDGITHDPVGTPPHSGRAQIREFISGIMSGFESVGLTEDHVFVSANSAAVKWTGRGTTKNGAEVTFEGIDVIDFDEDGKIQLVRAFWDPAPVMAALQE